MIPLTLYVIPRRHDAAGALFLPALYRFGLARTRGCNRQLITMKKLLTAIVATSVVLTFVLLAPPQRVTTAATPSKSVLIEGVPHVKQKPDFCGEACVEMYLRKLGHKFDQDDVFDQSQLDPAKGRGCYTADLKRAMQKIGFNIGSVFYSVAAKSDKQIAAQFDAMCADLKKGVPSIVCTHYDDSPGTTEHFRLVLGYDAKTNEVIYHEPAVANGAYRRMKRDMFTKLWPLKYNASKWTLVRLRLEPRKIRLEPSNVRGRRFTSADYAQHVLKLRKKLPKGFTIVVEPPFVVMGDEPAATVKRRTERTVAWATRMLRKEYFDKDPNDILDIWLFKDKTSYRKHTRSLFNDNPSTPFGYYSPTDKALIMNISTGGGTLVHEIVHPFVASNFPDCPSWLNEGMGSLYEQCGERNGRIMGFTNWRLSGLQKAIRAKKVPSFKALTGTSTYEFYNEDRGTNYSQARYLCYYLQQKDLLKKFYREFLSNHKTDPTGYKSLQKVLNEKDMDAFKKKWEAYVLKLRYR